MLKFVLYWIIVGAVHGSYLDLKAAPFYDNLRPCTFNTTVLPNGGPPEYNQLGTKTHFTQVCINQRNSDSTCEQAWSIFETILNSTTLPMNGGSYADYSQFIDLFDWRRDMQTHNRIPIFYAQTGQCPDLVHRVTNTTGVREITLEDQSGVQSVASRMWCNETSYVSSNGTCINQTVWGQRPNYNCSSCSYDGAAFWIQASRRFADISFGIPKVMIRPFTNGSFVFPAFVSSSVFATEELPALQLNPDVVGLTIIVVSINSNLTELCGSGSVSLLQQVIQNTNNSATGTPWEEACLVDPPCVLKVLCDEEADLSPGVTISNFKKKCNYFKKYWTAAQVLSCDCTTAFFDTGKESAFDCPGVKQYSTNESVDDNSDDEGDIVVVSSLGAVAGVLALAFGITAFLACWKNKISSV